MAWNICLVSDNEAIQHLFTRTFAYRGDISIKSCETAEEARQEASNDSLHLMIIAATLPDGDGYDLCKELKEEAKVKFPILLIEDIFEDIDLDRCLEAQTDGFISKPFEEELIAEKVDEVIRSVESETSLERAEEDQEELKGMAGMREEESPASAMLSSEEEEEEGILDLTDLVPEEEEAAVPLDEVETEKEEMPPSIATALEESVSELEKMEAMEGATLEERAFIEEATPEETEEVRPEPEPKSAEVTPASPATSAAAPGLSREEIEELLSVMVEQTVQKTLEEKLPGLVREGMAKALASLAEALK